MISRVFHARNAFNIFLSSDNAVDNAQQMREECSE